DHAAVFAKAELVVKVKEPLPAEYDLLRAGQLLFTYLHLAANRGLTEALLKSGVTALAYETIEVNRRLPLLEPMSEIAGRMSVLVGGYFLAKHCNGSGVLLGGVPGVLPGRVVVLGGGVSGINAARMGMGLGADVTILEVDLERMRLVDIAIDQGGCAETSRPTTHHDPTFVEEGVIHYCVANMPAAYARTATQALTNITFRYVEQLADLGLEGACERNAAILTGLNVQ